MWAAAHRRTAAHGHPQSRRVASDGPRHVDTATIPDRIARIRTSTAARGVPVNTLSWSHARSHLQALTRAGAARPRSRRSVRRRRDAQLLAPRRMRRSAPVLVHARSMHACIRGRVVPVSWLAPGGMDSLPHKCGYAVRHRAPTVPRRRNAHSTRAPFARDDPRSVWTAARCTPAYAEGGDAESADPRGCCPWEPYGVAHRPHRTLLSRAARIAVARDDTAGPSHRRATSGCRRVPSWLDHLDECAGWRGADTPAHEKSARLRPSRSSARACRPGIGGVARASRRCGGAS
jgi:hypothetical protein